MASVSVPASARSRRPISVSRPDGPVVSALAVAAALGAALPAVATAHGTEVPPEPDVGAMLLGWTFEPLVAIPLAAAGLLWWLAVRRVNAAHPTTPMPRARSALFGFALVALAVALMSGIDAYDTTLFTVHMVQHILLAMVAAPLIVMAGPITLLLRFVSPDDRRRYILPLPRTWPEVAEYSKKLVAAGYQAGFSSAWTSWVHLENLSAWHNVPLGTKANGFGGLDARLTYNGPLHVKHFQQLADWQKDKVFVYGGRTNTGNAKFSSEQVAMYTESSAGYAGFAKTCKFEFGTSMLPFWPDVKGAPLNTIIGGASLWVMAGLPADDYKGVAAFFNYISSPEVMADWHQFTGYLPITMSAYELTKKQGFYDKNPSLETALKQMTLNKPTDNSKGLRFGYFSQIRDINDNEFEATFSGQKTAKKGLDDAVAAGNKLVEKFQKENK